MYVNNIKKLIWAYYAAENANLKVCGLKEARDAAHSIQHVTNLENH